MKQSAIPYPHSKRFNRYYMNHGDPKKASHVPVIIVISVPKLLSHYQVLYHTCADTILVEGFLPRDCLLGAVNFMSGNWTKWNEWYDSVHDWPQMPNIEEKAEETATILARCLTSYSRVTGVGA